MTTNDNVARPLVDSVTDLGDTGGALLDSCVSIIVGGSKDVRGNIVQQSIMPGHTHCTDIFIQSWELLLNAKWNQVMITGDFNISVGHKLKPFSGC